MSHSFPVIDLKVIKEIAHALNRVDAKDTYQSIRNESMKVVLCTKLHNRESKVS